MLIISDLLQMNVICVNNVLCKPFSVIQYSLQVFVGMNNFNTYTTINSWKAEYVTD